MSILAIRGFLIDDTNERKFNRNKVSSQQVEQVLGNRFLVVPNRRARRAQFLVIGVDNGGACISIPIEPTTDPGVWRPVTAWPAKDHERARLRQKGGKS
jgi:hypothetical protein